MADSVSGKHTKNISNVKGKPSKNDLAQTASELESQGENSAGSPSDISQGTEALNDLLQYDTRVLTFDSTKSEGITGDIELAGDSEIQRYEPSSQVSNDPKVTRKFVADIDNDINNDPEFDGGSKFKVSNEFKSGVDRGINEALTSSHEQNERTLQLESELSDLKEKLYFQGKFDRLLEASSDKLKKVSVFTLILAILALLMSFLLGILYLNMQAEFEESKRHVVIVKESRPFPVIEPEDPGIVDLRIQAKELPMSEIIKPIAGLIESKDDISEIRVGDEIINAELNEVAKEPTTGLDQTIKVPATELNQAIKVPTTELNKIDKVPVTGWGVNLYSYENHSDALKKIEELKNKNISPEMIIVNVKGVQWYRIRVTGFKTQSEAKSYAAKIKKTLNISLSWVSKI